MVNERMQTDVPRGTPAARKDQAALETPIHLGILPDPAFLAIVPSIRSFFI
jgi:hypothetical protein